jgi:hypothetical protein
VGTSGAATRAAAPEPALLLPAVSPPAEAAPIISRAAEPDTASPAGAPAAPAGEEGGTVVAPPSAQPAVAVAAAIQRREASNVGDNGEVEIRNMPDSRVEELGDRLFDHIRARLRAELLVDRERAGLLGDVR